MNIYYFLTKSTDANVETRRGGSRSRYVGSLEGSESRQRCTAELCVVRTGIPVRETPATVDEDPQINADDNGDAPDVEVHQVDTLLGINLLF